MHCIETKNLTHKYADNQIVLDRLNLQIPKGAIYGFLGPNGAGKTTTLRLLLGLLKKQQGEITIFNQPFDANRIEILKQIGSLIESPSLYDHLTATENLRVWQKCYQCPPSRTQEVLEIVGLANTGKKKAGQFSLGMKQRLSIAIALLHNPSLLILDEPTNGLDPNGIIEIRELLKTLNSREQLTIVISSHLLAEIEKMVTHLGVINKGRILFQGTLAELHLKQSLSATVCFETNNPAQTKSVIESNGLIASLRDNEIFIPVVEKSVVANLNEQLVRQGIEVYRISKVQNDLEAIFIDLINN